MISISMLEELFQGKWWKTHDPRPGSARTVITSSLYYYQPHNTPKWGQKERPAYISKLKRNKFNAV